VETAAVAGFSVLAFAGILCVIRLARGPSLADRVLALDSLLIVGVVGVAIESARTRSGAYLDVLLIVALVAFIGTTAVARFIERRGVR
jgi:multicomponent Na+:H+ antiporter subunit F